VVDRNWTDIDCSLADKKRRQQADRMAELMQLALALSVLSFPV
jgi:hypothetical protein